MSTAQSAARSLREIGWPAGEPRLLALLPLVYIAWTDSDIGAEQIESIADRVREFDWPDEAKREIVRDWLNPQEGPPDPARLRRLLNIIRGLARGLPRTSYSLSELGVDLVEAAADGDQLATVSSEARRLLRQIERSLDIDGVSACRELLSPEGERPDVLVPEPAATFDVQSMNRLLGGAYRETRQRVLELLRAPMFRHRYGLDLVTYRERVHAWCGELARRGFGAAALAPEYGGTGDIGRLIVTIETLGFHDLSLATKFGVQFGLFAGAIDRLGTERHRQRYLRAAASLELPGCFAMSEAAHGSNIRDIETEARFDPEEGEFIIHTPAGRARKEYISNAGRYARMAIVFAQLEVDGVRYGVHAFLVPIRDGEGKLSQGVRVRDDGEKIGLNGIDNGAIWFDNVRIPRENLLSRFSYVSQDGVYATTIPSDSKRFFTLISMLVDGRIGLAGVSLSAAKSGLTIAIRYGSRRRQFGPPGEPETKLLDYQIHQRRLMPRLATAYAIDFTLKQLIRRFLAHSDEGSREIEVSAAGLKAYSSWFARDTLQVCRECCGGAGYMVVNRLGLLRADSDAFCTYQGDNIILMQLVARSLFSGTGRMFEESNFLVTVKGLARQAARKIAELNPIVVRLSDESHLRNPDFQLGIFRHREARLLEVVARSLKERINRGASPFEAFSGCQNDLIRLANAHIEREMLEQFVEALEDLPSTDLVAILRKLCSLFALSCVEADLAWFLETGYLEGRRARALRRTVDTLCAEVRQQAVPLVDAFGIPDELLGAPIALQDLQKRRERS